MYRRTVQQLTQDKPISQEPHVKDLKLNCHGWEITRKYTESKNCDGYGDGGCMQSMSHWAQEYYEHCSKRKGDGESWSGKTVRWLIEDY